MMGVAEPATRTPTREEQGEKAALLPPWAVVLHNDDHNDMIHVVSSLLKCIPKLSRTRAVSIMLEAHTTGRARVTVCPLELAELYRDRLESCGLTATIEKV